MTDTQKEIEAILDGLDQIEYTDNGIAPLSREQAVQALTALYRHGQAQVLESLQQDHESGAFYSEIIATRLREYSNDQK